MLLEYPKDDEDYEELREFVSREHKKKALKKPKPKNPVKKSNPNPNPNPNPNRNQNRGKKRVLQIKDKLKIIEYVEEGHTVTNASQKFGVPRSTIDTWLKTKDEMRAFKNTDKKTMHPGAIPKYKIKDEILSNLRDLNYLFSDDEDNCKYNDEDDDDEEEEEDDNEEEESESDHEEERRMFGFHEV